MILLVDIEADVSVCEMPSDIDVRRWFIINCYGYTHPPSKLGKMDDPVDSFFVLRIPPVALHSSGIGCRRSKRVRQDACCPPHNRPYATAGEGVAKWSDGAGKCRRVQGQSRPSRRLSGGGGEYCKWCGAAEGYVAWGNDRQPSSVSLNAASRIDSLCSSSSISVSRSTRRLATVGAKQQSHVIYVRGVVFA